MSLGCILMEATVHLTRRHAWMDEGSMSKLIHLALVLSMNSKAPNIVQLLILGAYHNMIGKIVY